MTHDDDDSDNDDNRTTSTTAITGLRSCPIHEPRVVTDTPGYGEAVFAIGGVKLQALEAKH